MPYLTCSREVEFPKAGEGKLAWGLRVMYESSWCCMKTVENGVGGMEREGQVREGGRPMSAIGSLFGISPTKT